MSIIPYPGVRQDGIKGKCKEAGTGYYQWWIAEITLIQESHSF
jgi:hypothetical protein